MEVRILLLGCETWVSQVSFHASSPQTFCSVQTQLNAHRQLLALRANIEAVDNDIHDWLTEKLIRVL